MELVNKGGVVTETTKIGLVLTGGTIASDNVGGKMVIDITGNDLAEERLIKECWRDGSVDVYTRAPLRKHSEDMCPRDWVRIGDAVRELVERELVSSVLVLHGTDTAAYTAAALSLLLADLDATVVITASNKPANEPDSDALTNVRDALVAVSKLPHGVYLSFAGTPNTDSEVHLGSAVRKVRPWGQAYESPNTGAVACVEHGNLRIVREWSRPTVTRSNNAMSEKVALIDLHPGIDLDMMAAALIATNKRGVVVRMYPCATGPSLEPSHGLGHFTERCVAAGITVVAAVDHFVAHAPTYPSLLEMLAAGALFADDTIPEAAFVKLCWAIEQGRQRAVHQHFLEPVAAAVTTVDGF